MRGTLSRVWFGGMVLLACAAVVPGLSATASAEDSTAKPNKQESQPGDGILGEWWTEDNEGRVKLYRHKDGTIRGKTTCCEEGKKDVENPNPKLRDRPTVGILIIWNLAYQGDSEFEGGYVYNPRDGDTYRIEAKIVDDETIEIRGYLGISLLGQTQTWKRAHGVKGNKRPAGK